YGHDNLQIIRETPRLAHPRTGAYTMVESSTRESNWVHTSPSQVECTLEEYDTMFVDWGNVSLGAGGANAAPLWAARDGQALITTDDLAFLSSLYLRNARGADFNPATTKSLSNWLVRATADNMAYALSVQLAAM